MDGEQEKKRLLLDRFKVFLATDAEDYWARERIALTEEDLDLLHELMLKGEIAASFYHEIAIAHRADMMHKRDDWPDSYSIRETRRLLSEEERAVFLDEGMEVEQVTYSKFLPIFKLINRVKRNSQTGTWVENEVEMQILAPQWELEQAWAVFRSDLQNLAVELARKVHKGILGKYEGQSLMDLAMTTDYTFCYTVSKDEQRKTERFPLLHAYEGLIKKTVSDSVSQDEAWEEREDREGEAKTAFLDLVIREYDSSNISLPAFLENQLFWKLSHLRRHERWWERRSKGNLDERVTGSSGTPRDDGALLHEVLCSEGPSPLQILEQKQRAILAERARDLFIKEMGTDLYRMLYEEKKTYEEAAAALGITGDALAKRIQRCRDKIRPKV